MGRWEEESAKGEETTRGREVGERKQLLASSNADSPPASIPPADVLMLLMTDVLVFLKEGPEVHLSLPW